MSNERTPLLSRHSHRAGTSGSGHRLAIDPHEQFCRLAGVPASNLLPGAKAPPVPRKSLYGRASRQYNSSKRNYAFSAALSNTLLLSQVILGAALTALGASASSHILITVFGAMNTVIAGLVAYLKSRGQPMRSRMFRDDLERVVDEMENSEVMWLGISEGIHGYEDIDIDDKVTVRSEVARLTRLYERAVRNNTANNPDNYLMSVGDNGGTVLRNRPSTQPTIPPPAPGPTPGPSTQAPAAPAPADPDESPATAPRPPKLADDTVEGTDGPPKESDKPAEPAKSTADSDSGKAKEDSAGSKPEPADKPDESNKKGGETASSNPNSSDLVL